VKVITTRLAPRGLRATCSQLMGHPSPSCAELSRRAEVAACGVQALRILCDRGSCGHACAYRDSPRRCSQQLGGHVPGEDDEGGSEDRRGRCWPWCAWKGTRDEADTLESLMRRVVEKHCPSLLTI
jgi:hypothetical protein